MEERYDELVIRISLISLRLWSSPPREDKEMRVDVDILIGTLRNKSITYSFLSSSIPLPRIAGTTVAVENTATRIVRWSDAETSGDLAYRPYYLFLSSACFKIH